MLTTGQVGLSARDEVEPSFFARTAVLLAAALGGARPSVPDVAPVSVLAGTAIAGCLLATVLFVDGDGTLDPLLTVGVAPRTSQSAPLWRRLHRVSSPLATRADRVPAQPWCASRLEPGIFTHPEAGQWIGCLERCLAWTWIRYVEEGCWPGIH